MFLYIFGDAVTGEFQQPILAHNDNEAIRIARMAFANVPHQILHDLYLGRVKSYDYDIEPKYAIDLLFLGSDYISEVQADAEKNA